MRRRDLVTLLGGATAAWPLRALAQAPARVYRVGLLGLADNRSPYEAPFIRGLARHGYAVDRNLAIERRGGEVDRVAQFVAELMASKVEVIVAVGYPSARAAKQETTLPVVAFSAGDPVETSLVDSLARPGGHMTGISDVSVEVTPKRLELLKEFTPSLRRWRCCGTPTTSP